jgi:hypothetical protein
VRVLLVDTPDSLYTERRRIWACEASIWAKHVDPASLALAIGDEIHKPDSPILKKVRERFTIDLTGYRCVGVVEATDQEMETLANAGYQLTDLRKAMAAELLEALWQ